MSSVLFGIVSPPITFQRGVDLGRKKLEIWSRNSVEFSCLHQSQIFADVEQLKRPRVRIYDFVKPLDNDSPFLQNLANPYHPATHQAGVFRAAFWNDTARNPKDTCSLISARLRFAKYYQEHCEISKFLRPHVEPKWKRSLWQFELVKKLYSPLEMK